MTHVAVPKPVVAVRSWEKTRGVAATQAVCF